MVLRRSGWRVWLLIGATAVSVAAAILAPAFPQPLSYHDFADCRSFLSIPNFLNVTSNAPFLIAGAYGLAISLIPSDRRFVSGDERLPYLIFFLGAALTTFGSMYYHAVPDNVRLVWDRLPMTLGFAGLTAAVIGERINARVGRRALWPLLAAGVATVLYWYATERAGRGNVMPYGIYQAWTIAIVAFAALAFPSRRYSHGAALWWVVALYAIAKIAEAFDLAIYRMGQIVSGHTLKHLFAAAAVFAVAEIVRRRVATGHVGEPS
ncbi:MAG: alkaline phytoceramidase [Steroidobacteraceae bacterium]